MSRLRYQLVSRDRSQAIESGELLDVSWASALAGHPWPVAITATAWEAIVSASSRSGSDSRDVLYDVLLTLAADVRKRGVRAEVVFDAEVRGGTLIALYGPGDFGEPVIEIQAPWERRTSNKREL